MAGYLTSRGYYHIEVRGEVVKAHRAVWMLFNGSIPEGLVPDHKDGDTKNNRIDNLRLVTRAVNNRNASKRKDNSSGVTGVSFCGIHQAYVVQWNDLETGKRRRKAFAIKRRGDEKAKQLAIEFRQATLAKLNQQGAGYTDRHGT